MKLEVKNNLENTILLKIIKDKRILKEYEISPNILINIEEDDLENFLLTFHKENPINKYIFKRDFYFRFPFLKLTTWNNPIIIDNGLNK